MLYSAARFTNRYTVQLLRITITEYSPIWHLQQNNTTTTSINQQQPLIFSKHIHSMPTFQAISNIITLVFSYHHLLKCHMPSVVCFSISYNFFLTTHRIHTNIFQFLFYMLFLYSITISYMLSIHLQTQYIFPLQSLYIFNFIQILISCKFHLPSSTQHLYSWVSSHCLKPYTKTTRGIKS